VTSKKEENFSFVLFLYILPEWKTCSIDRRFLFPINFNVKSQFKEWNFFFIYLLFISIYCLTFVKKKEAINNVRGNSLLWHVQTVTRGGRNVFWGWVSGWCLNCVDLS
jgi:hypothetical protein